MDSEDLERIQQDYADVDGALTRDDIEQDLSSEGFEGGSLDAASEGIAGKNDLALSQEALSRAQREAVESLGDGGAVGEVVRAEDGFTTIGAPENVTQSVERIDDNTGAVIAENRNTGTSGKIGEIELAPPPEGS
jgi:hypothetical protein